MAVLHQFCAFSIGLIEYIEKVLNMKISRTLALVGIAALFASSVAGAAELRTLTPIQKVDIGKVSVKTVPKPLEIQKIYKHNCESEGYQCAGGYTCELLMTQSGEDARGNPASMSGTKQNFYKCELSGRTYSPTCSKGMTPTGNFIDGLGRDLRRIPGGVREYFCQIVL